MDYEEMYKLALERARSLSCSSEYEGYKKIFENIFPELAESDDLEEAAKKLFPDWTDTSNLQLDAQEQSIIRISRDAFKAGADWQKQQMMKQAVDAKACAVYPLKTCNEVHYSVQYPIGVLPQKDGDKVKVIIIKEG